ncbi:MAG: nuclear transport factor 2 family protein [Hyphomicrobiales bacterium]
MTPEKFDLAEQRYINAIQNLSREKLDGFFELTAADIEFRDPFNHTRGREPMREIFEDMFEKLDPVSFEILEHVSDHERGLVFMYWIFRAGNKLTGPMEFAGMSRVHLNAEGKVDAHLDFWDAASELYEKVPVMGSVLRAMKSRLRVEEGQITN